MKSKLIKMQLYKNKISLFLFNPYCNFLHLFYDNKLNEVTWISLSGLKTIFLLL